MGNIISWTFDIVVGTPLVWIAADPAITQEIEGLYEVVKDEHPVSRTIWITLIVLAFCVKVIGVNNLRELLKLKKRKKKDAESEQ